MSISLSQKHRQSSKVNFTLFWSFVFLALLAFSAAAALFAYSYFRPEPTYQIIDYSGLGQPAINSLTDEQRLLVAAIVGTIALIFAIIERTRIVFKRSLYAESGCPQCQQHELVRTDRTAKDRILGIAGIPVYRYDCRNCTWRGQRIGLYDTQTYFHKKPSGAIDDAQALGSPQILETRVPGQDLHQDVPEEPVSTREQRAKIKYELVDLVWATNSVPAVESVQEDAVNPKVAAPDIDDSTDETGSEPQSVGSDFKAPKTAESITVVGKSNGHYVPLARPLGAVDNISVSAQLDLEPEDFERLLLDVVSEKSK